VLEAAGTAEARLLLITAPAAIAALHIARLARQLQPELAVVARAEGVTQLTALRSEGVETVVQPEFEAGLQMSRQALLRLGIPLEQIHRYTDTVRRELYAPLQAEDVSFDQLELFRDPAHLLEITWATLQPGSPLAGRTLGESAIRTRCGASVVGVLRDGRLHRAPAAAFQLREGDEVAVIGEGEERAALQALAAPA